MVLFMLKVCYYHIAAKFDKLGELSMIRQLNCTYLIVIPWARVVCLIYTPEARGLRVYISGEPRVHMV